MPNILKRSLWRMLTETEVEGAPAGTPAEGSHKEGSGELFEEEGESEAHLAILFLFFSLFMGALCRSLLMNTKVPYTVALLIVGLILGFIHAKEDLGIYAGPSIKQWVNISPHLLLFAFLPPLIFESAFNLEWHMFSKLFSQAMLMATVGVVFTVVLVGGFLKWVLPYDWSWEFSFMFASILAATDPVAVVALLNDLGASKTLSILIEGESMLNDGTAIVMFLLFFDFSLGNDKSAGEIIEFFVQVPLAGPAIGIAFGIATLWWLGKVYNDALIDISLTVVDCYLVYFVSEEVSGSSGVLGVVALGAYLAAVGKPYFATNKEVEHTLHHFWGMMTYGANTVLFVLAGVIIAVSVIRDDEYLEMEDLGYAFALYGFLNVARGTVVLALFPLLKRIGYGLDWRNAVIVVWGGLRGAVGLALALIVFEEHAFDQRARTLVLFHTGFIVVATLVVNGSTTGMILHALGLDKAGINKTAVVESLQTAMGERTMKIYLENFYDDTLGGADFDLVKEYVTSLRLLDEKRNQPALAEPLTPRATKGDLADDAHKTVHHPSNEAVVTEDLRKRALSSVRLSYKELSEEGEGNSNSIFMLLESVDKALDDTTQPLNDWKFLEIEHEKARASLGGVMYSLRLVPIPAPLRKMCNPADPIKEAETKLISVWSFVHAHTHACEVLTKQVDNIDKHALDKVVAESKAQVALAKAYLVDRRVAFPELVQTIKTAELARELLNVQEQFLIDVSHTGLLEQSELDAIHDIVQADFRKFVAHPPSKRNPTDDSVIRALPLFAIDNAEEVYAKYRSAFAPMKGMDIGKPLYEKGAVEDKVIFIGRGVISVTHEAVVHHDTHSDGQHSHSIKLNNLSKLPADRVWLDRSRHSGWVCGLHEVLVHKAGSAPPTRNYTVVCETVMMAYEIDGAVVRQMAEEYPQVKRVLWSACASMLCETVLKDDLTLELGLNLHMSFERGECKELVPPVKVDAKNLVLLLEGSLTAPSAEGSGGSVVVNAPALLNYSKRLAAAITSFSSTGGNLIFNAPLQNDLRPGGMSQAKKTAMLITHFKTEMKRGLGDHHGMARLN